MTDEKPENKPSPSAHQSKSDEGQSYQERSRKIRVEAYIPPNLVQRYDAANAEKKAREDKKYRLEVTTLVVATIYAALTLGLVLLSKQANETSRKSLETTQRAFQLEQRPYLWIVPKEEGIPKYIPIPRPDNASNGQILWTWHYTNYGKSPAYHVRYRHYMSVDGGPFFESYQAREQGGIAPPIPPTQDLESTVVSIPGFTPAQFNHGIGIGGKGIAIRVMIDYADSYSSQYQTGICLHVLNTGAVAYCPDEKENYIK